MEGRKQIELIINGDFLDFLAEEVSSISRHRSFAADQSEVIATFNTIAERDAKVFDALRAVLACGASITILLGNHDVELSLPAVRKQLRMRLGAQGGDRFQFIYDGEAYVIGEILIEHGNR